MLSPWKHDESAWLWIPSLTDVLHLYFSAINCLGPEHNLTSVHQLMLEDAVLVRSPTQVGLVGASPTAILGFIALGSKQRPYLAANELFRIDCHIPGST